FYKILTCESLYEWLSSNLEVDFAIIDYELPPYREKELMNGGDCALLLRSLKPDCNIIIRTSHEETVILYNIYQTCKADALIGKSVFSEKMITAIFNQQTTRPFYPARAKQAITLTNKKETLLDAKNREIRMYLAQGFKIAQLEDYVSMTKSGI